MTGKSTTLAVRVPLDLDRRLKQLAAEDKRTLSQFCMLILAEYVERRDKGAK